jgi:hypothetical protein
MLDPLRISRDDGPRRATLGGLLTRHWTRSTMAMGRSWACRLMPIRSQAQWRAELLDLGTDAPTVGGVDTHPDSAFGGPWIRIDDAELAIVAAFGLLSRSRVNMPISA